MGGDKAPAVTVEGVCMASLDYDADYILFGDEQRILDEMKKYPHKPERIRIIHTAQQIKMHDNPRTAVKEKSDASILLTAKYLNEGKADAMVSAGSTGAVILSAAKHIKRIPGVKHTALGIVYPTH